MKPDKKSDNPLAFPTDYTKTKKGNTIVIEKFPHEGMTLLDYFIAHAPASPQWEFDVPMETTLQNH